MVESIPIIIYAVTVIIIRLACRNFLSKLKKSGSQAALVKNANNKHDILERISSWPDLFDAEPLINYDDAWGKEITESSLKRAHHMLTTASKRLDEEAFTASESEDSDESPAHFEFKALRRDFNRSPHGSIIPRDLAATESKSSINQGNCTPKVILQPFLPPSPGTVTAINGRDPPTDDLGESPTSIPTSNSRLSSPTIIKPEVKASFLRAPKRRISSVLSGYLNYRAKA